MGILFLCSLSRVSILELEEACRGLGDVQKGDSYALLFTEGLYKHHRCLPEAGGGAGQEPNLRGGDRGRGRDKACWSGNS